jgi:hypothetical protein
MDGKRKALFNGWKGPCARTLRSGTLGTSVKDIATYTAIDTDFTCYCVKRKK